MAKAKATVKTSDYGDVCSQVMHSLSLKRRARRWGLVVFLSFFYLVFLRSGPPVTPESYGRHIATVKVSGAVEGLSDGWYRQLELVSKSSNAAALLLVIDSPGGVVSIADAGYSILKRIHARMPVVTVVGNTAASAGYLLASTGDVIFARETSVVGSIGVLLEIPVFKNLLKNIGVEYRNIGVGDNLDVVPFQGLTEFTNKYLTLAGQDSYRWFRAIVQYERRLSDQALSKVIGGKIFLGHEAVELGLIDDIGDQTSAMSWLNKHDSSFTSSTPVVDYSLFVSQG